jgi:hypothetical protein
MTVMSEEECHHAKCHQCNTAILNTSEDFIRLAIVHDRRVRAQTQRSETQWAELEAFFALESPGLPRHTNAEFPVPCTHFRSALLDARHSFHLPASAMPHEINFVNYPETKHISHALAQHLSADSDAPPMMGMMIVAGEITMGLLIEFSTNALKQYAGFSHYSGGGTTSTATGVATADVWTILPPAYRHFVIRWFMRTLHLVYMRFKRGFAGEGGC